MGENSAKTAVIYLGIFTILSYSVVKVLNFYGMNVYEYAPYAIFWCFLLISAFVLHKPTIDDISEPSGSSALIPPTVTVAQEFIPPTVTAPQELIPPTITLNTRTNE